MMLDCNEKLMESQDLYKKKVGWLVRPLVCTKSGELKHFAQTHRPAELKFVFPWRGIGHEEGEIDPERFQSDAGEERGTCSLTNKRIERRKPDTDSKVCFKSLIPQEIAGLRDTSRIEKDRAA